MSGHSKFANIKHKKEKNDAAKGKIFTIIGREIAIAVKEGGSDPANNSKLRDVIAKAKANNMPNDTIDRGIKKAAGSADAVNYETVTYEGYGPSGTAIIVKALTDNKNRTAANVRNAFTKGQGSIGTQGCVSYMFDEKGHWMPEQMILTKRTRITRSSLRRMHSARYARHWKKRIFQWQMQRLRCCHRPMWNFPMKKILPIFRESLIFWMKMMMFRKYIITGMNKKYPHPVSG